MMTTVAARTQKFDATRLGRTLERGQAWRWMGSAARLGTRVAVGRHKPAAVLRATNAGAGRGGRRGEFGMRQEERGVGEEAVGDEWRDRRWRWILKLIGRLFVIRCLETCFFYRHVLWRLLITSYSLRGCIDKVC